MRKKSLYTGFPDVCVLLFAVGSCAVVLSISSVAEEYRLGMAWAERVLQRLPSPTPLRLIGPSFTKSGCSEPCLA